MKSVVFLIALIAMSSATHITWTNLVPGEVTPHTGSACSGYGLILSKTGHMGDAVRFSFTSDVDVNVDVTNNQYVVDMANIEGSCDVDIINSDQDVMYDEWYISATTVDRVIEIPACWITSDHIYLFVRSENDAYSTTVKAEFFTNYLVPTVIPSANNTAVVYNTTAHADPVDGEYAMYLDVFTYNIGIQTTGSLLTLSTEGNNLAMNDVQYDATGTTTTTQCGHIDSPHYRSFTFKDYSGTADVYAEMPAPGETTLRIPVFIQPYAWADPELSVSVIRTPLTCSNTMVGTASPLCAPITTYQTPELEKMMMMSNSTAYLSKEMFIEMQMTEKCIDKIMMPLVCAKMLRECDANGIPMLPCEDVCISEATMVLFGTKAMAACPNSNRRDVNHAIERAFIKLGLNTARSADCTSCYNVYQKIIDFNPGNSSAASLTVVMSLVLMIALLF